MKVLGKKLVYLSDPLPYKETNPAVLGDFGLIAIELLQLIISKLNYFNIGQLRRVHHLFIAIVRPFFEYAVLCFSNPSQL